MFKRFIILFTTLMITVLMAGCQSGSPESPKAPLDKYFAALLKSDFSAAYSQLCKADKAVISEEDFKTWQTLYKQTEEMKTYKLNSSKELDSFKDPFGNRYPQAVEFSITQTDFVHSSKTENTYDYTRTVVLEDGQWKICRGEAADIYQHRLYYGYSTLGAMYTEGKVVEKDPAKALSYYTSALDYNESDMTLYFNAALLNLQAKMPAEAEALCKRALSKNPEAAMGSDIQNLMGVALTMQERKDEAKQAFATAVQLNPDNMDAAGNLKNLTQ